MQGVVAADSNPAVRDVALSFLISLFGRMKMKPAHDQSPPFLRSKAHFKKPKAVLGPRFLPF